MGTKDRSPADELASGQKRDVASSGPVRQSAPRRNLPLLLVTLVLFLAWLCYLGLVAFGR